MCMSYNADCGWDAFANDCRGMRVGTVSSLGVWRRVRSWNRTMPKTTQSIISNAECVARRGTLGFEQSHTML